MLLDFIRSHRKFGSHISSCPCCYSLTDKQKWHLVNHSKDGLFVSVFLSGIIFIDSLISIIYIIFCQKKKIK